MICIIFLQHSSHRQSVFAKSLTTVSVHIPAGCIRRTVGSVTSYREYSSGKTFDSRYCSQSQFLIPSAKALSGQMNHRLAAGQEGNLLAAPGMSPQNTSQEASCFPCLAAELIRQKHGLIPKLCTFCRSGTAKLPHTSGNLGGHIIQFLWSFFAKKLLRLFRKV